MKSFLPIKHHVLIVCLSLLAVFLTLFLPVKVKSHSEMSQVALGYPLSYLEQDLSRRDPPSFPRYFSLMLPHENPILTIKYITLLVNIVIWILIFEFFACFYIFGKEKLASLFSFHLNVHRLRQKRHFPVL